MAVIPIYQPQQEAHRASENMTEDLQKEALQVEHVEGTVRLFDSNKQIRKIPIPSGDPSDPLTWSSLKRCLILLSLCTYGIVGFGVVQSTPLFFSEIIESYERQTRGQFNIPSISQLASYPSLCMGIGNFLFVPLSMMVGRRAVFILNNILMLAAIIWAAKSIDFNNHLAARCLQGLSCGISDCLLPIIILDMTFLHRRGFWMSFYWASTAAGSTGLLVAVPFVVQSTGGNWRTNYWFWSGFSALSLVMAIFLLPETFFAREPALIDGQLVITDDFGNVTLVAAEDAIVPSQVQSSPEQVTDSSHAYLKTLYPIKYQEHGVQRFCKTYAQMALSLLSPSILWVLILNSILFGGLVSQSLTYSTQLALPPWNFSTAVVGTAQAGSFFGAIIALGLSGATIDRVSGFLTKRNGGVREPEHLLPNFVLPTLLAFAGMVVYGVVAANPESHPWIGVHISFGVYYCGFVALSAVSGVWIGEATPHWSGAALVLVCGGRNALGFSISNNFPRWIASQGFQNAYIELGSALLGVMCVGIVPLYLWNKKVRKAWGNGLGFDLK